MPGVPVAVAAGAATVVAGTIGGGTVVAVGTPGGPWAPTFLVEPPPVFVA